MLPKVEGTSVCNQLKRNERYSRIPIVMLTARDKEIDAELGKIAGADAYITKPFDLENLVLKIKELLEEAEKSRKSG
jgi:DNA-binding response OmpR family regulator